MENFPEITAVQSTEGRDILYADIILEVLFDEGQGFFDVEISDLSALFYPARGRGTGQVIQKKIQVTDQMKGLHI